MDNKKNNLKYFVFSLVFIFIITQVVIDVMLNKYLTNNGLNSIHCELARPNEILEKNLKSTVSIIDGVDFSKGETISEITLGSGIIYSSAGLIITNYHVIKGMNTINVVLFDNSNYIADVIAFDEGSDLALIKISDNKLIPAEFGKSSILKLGEQVYAIGTPLDLSLRGSISKGVISGIDRIGYGDFELLQSDIASSAGFSGGPLINLEGKVIGLNSFKNMEPGNEGLCFSLKIEDVQLIMDQFQKYYRARVVYTGVTISEKTLQKLGVYRERGVVVSNIGAGSPAEYAGMMTDDIIIKIDDRDIYSRYDYFEALRNVPDNRKLNITLIRNGNSLQLILVPIYI